MNLAERLTDISDRAVRENRLKAQEELRKREAEGARQIREAIAAAEKVMEGLEDALIEAAKKGDKFYTVCRVHYGDYSPAAAPGTPSNLSLRDITSVKIRHIFETLEAKGLNPSCDYQHDGMGMKGWHDLTVHWK